MNKVLVVDYQAIYREIISSLLQDTGYKVTVAQDGSEALEQIKVNPPDLIILDIIMPKVNGYELCRQVKSNPITKQIPVIVCSVMSEEFDRFWGMRQGADAYIAKPFQPQELQEMVQKMLAK